MPPAMNDIDFSWPGQWARMVKGSPEKGLSAHKLGFGGGHKVFTFVFWVKPNHEWLGQTAGLLDSLGLFSFRRGEARASPFLFLGGLVRFDRKVQAPLDGARPALPHAVDAHYFEAGGFLSEKHGFDRQSSAYAPCVLVQREME